MPQTEDEIQAELEAQKVTFSDKQQKKVEELIKEAMGRAGKKHDMKPLK